MKRALPLLVWLIVVLIVASAIPTPAEAAGGGIYCPTREEMITIIAHKADVERGGRVPKWRVWEIFNRESGLQHCWPDGTIKIGVTDDYGVGQMNRRGIWLDCSVNPHCRDWSMVYDAYAHVNLIMNYYDRYRDFCPWNPTPGGSCTPGCGYY